MLSARERIERLSQERKERGEGLGARERFAEFIKTADGWKNYLEVMAEHPGMGAWNAERIAEYRVVNGISDTQELLTFDDARRLGGHVRKGARGIPIAKPKTEQGPDGKPHVIQGEYDNEFKFPAQLCEGLSPNRYKGYPPKVHVESDQSMDMFMAATEGVDLDGLGAAENWAFCRRYGLLDGSEALPWFPEGNTPEDLIARCVEISRSLGAVCDRVDANIRAWRHPERYQDEGRDVAAARREVMGRRHQEGVTDQVPDKGRRAEVPSAGEDGATRREGTSQGSRQPKAGGVRPRDAGMGIGRTRPKGMPVPPPRPARERKAPSEVARPKQPPIPSPKSSADVLKAANAAPLGAAEGSRTRPLSQAQGGSSSAGRP